MLTGFKNFIMRGNVIELSTAVIIATAFTAIVTAVSTHLINPIIASFGGAKVGGLGFEIRPGNAATMVDFGAIITSVINFLIVAAVVYFLIIVPTNKLAELAKRNKKEEEAIAPPTSEELLTEIRDLLARANGTSGTTGTTAL